VAKPTILYNSIQLKQLQLIGLIGGNAQIYTLYSLH